MPGKLTIILCVLIAINAFPQTTIKNEKERRPSTAELRFEKLLVVGDDETSEEGFLARPVAVCTDSKGNIYVCDEKEFCIKVYDTEGTFLKKIGRKGQGPGEFRKPKSCEIIGDSVLYVLDDQVMDSKVNLFDLRGNYISSFTMSGVGTNALRYCPWAEELFITRRTQVVKLERAYRKPLNFSVCVCSPRGDLLHRFAPVAGRGMIENTEHCARNTFVTFPKNNRFLVAWSNPYTMTMYDQQFQAVKKITGFQKDFGPPRMHTMNAGGREISILAEDSQVRGLFTLPGGYILAEVFIIDKGIFYDLYSGEGVLLKRFPGRNKEWITHVDRHGYVYVTGNTNDVPVVRKYRVEVVRGE